MEFNKDIALGYIREWEELCEADGGKLWAVDLRMPVVIVDTVTREAVSNEPDFKAFPADAPISATWIEFDGKWYGTVPWQILPEASHSQRMGVIAHEAFHALQQTLFGQASEKAKQNTHLNELEARVLVFVELDALVAVLESDGEEQTKAAQAALSARAKRREIYGAGGEAAAEICEGTAVYTEVMMSDSKNILERAKEQAQSAREVALPNYYGYAAGSLYSFALDTLGIKWKQGLRHDSDLGYILAKTISPAEIDLNDYGYSEIFAIEKQAQEEREMHEKIIKDAFSSRSLLICKEEGRRAIWGHVIEIADFGKILRGQVEYIGDFGKIFVNKDNFVGALEAGGDLDFLAHKDGYCAVFAEDVQLSETSATGKYWELELNDGYTISQNAADFEIVKVQVART